MALPPYRKDGDGTGAAHIVSFLMPRRKSSLAHSPAVLPVTVAVGRRRRGQRVHIGKRLLCLCLVVLVAVSLVRHERRVTQARDGLSCHR